MGYLIELDSPSPRVSPGPRARTRATVEQRTPIVPAAVAQAVWSEAVVWLGEELPRGWVARLVAKAETVFSRNRGFRRRLLLQGNAGRDWLWAFMRHWLAALIWKHRRELFDRLPASYSVGDPLPQPAAVIPRRGATTNTRMTVSPMISTA
ncbi:MAG: hypothetical protein ABSC03_01450 [Verrucomicrobiota bacterium]|jgi:hypothetical protein